MVIRLVLSCGHAPLELAVSLGRSRLVSSPHIFESCAISKFWQFFSLALILFIQESYTRLENMWLNHGVPQAIVRVLEANTNFMAINWNLW